MGQSSPDIRTPRSASTEHWLTGNIRRSLRAHLTLLIASLILIPALLTSLVLVVGANNILRDELFRQLDALTDSKGEEIGVRIEEWLSAMERFSHRPLLLDSIQDLALPPDAPRHRASFTLLAGMLQDLTTSMHKSMGDAAILRLGDREPLTWYGFASRSEARAAMKAVAFKSPDQFEYPGVAETCLHLKAQTAVLPIVKLLRDPPNPAGKPVGVLIYRIHLDKALYASLRSTLSLGRTGEILLLDDQLRLLMPLRFAKAPLFQRLADPTAAKLAQNQTIQALEGPNYRGTQVLAAESPVPDTNWRMVAEIDVTEALAPLRRLASIWSVLVLLLLGAGLWLAGVTGSSLSRPILALSAAARRFAAGDLSARVSTRRQDELGELSESFNVMADRIAESRQELERQVAARTAELSATNEDLRRVNDEMGAFTYSVSHDLSSPLVSLQGLTGLLLRDYGDKLDEDGKRRLGRLQVNVEMMSALVGDLLELSRVGRLESAPVPVDLCRLIQQVVGSLHDSVTEASIEVVTPTEPCLKVLADPNRVQQILSNLISNAIKYRGQSQSPRIQVSFRGTPDQMVQISVKDNGMGIAPQYHETIFQPFQRLPEAKSLPGTGMGLAIARKIVQLYGGAIWVESEPGKGSTFHFTLPRAGDQE